MGDLESEAVRGYIILSLFFYLLGEGHGFFAGCGGCSIGCLRGVWVYNVVVALVTG